MPHTFEPKTHSVRTELRLARLAHQAMRRQVEGARQRLRALPERPALRSCAQPAQQSDT
ncbi:MAG: hypothetical protein N2561_03810 [Bacteroidetes bacterium]|nr:hypothetical protein [Bacteroidota bacterium]